MRELTKRLRILDYSVLSEDHVVDPMASTITLSAGKPLVIVLTGVAMKYRIPGILLEEYVRDFVVSFIKYYRLV